MNFSNFIRTLIHDGQLTVTARNTPVTPEELCDMTAVMQDYYNNDVADLPGAAPAFDPVAAVTAARYIYNIMHEKNLVESFSVAGTVTPSAIYSADLCLRFLPDLLSIHKNRPTATAILATAAHWPFSSTGMNVRTDSNVEVIISHSSLLQAYADRIIASKDAARCNHPEVMAIVTTSLGNYADLLWPGFRRTFEHHD
ncbi:MAG TPA: hypothetical protein VM802_05500 [Chitinophaga sp.]|uniref:hypothetical protein n=1 Tax=Chitinophaga sp. TaxID=1869181 RepID=UPI002CC82DF2|nr:hypothetical protein [Chitinophaga sp.]HVI44299.1 hypothetical protein [Chitinophaga sp.]